MEKTGRRNDTKVTFGCFLRCRVGHIPGTLIALSGPQHEGRSPKLRPAAIPFFAWQNGNPAHTATGLADETYVKRESSY